MGDDIMKKPHGGKIERRWKRMKNEG